MTVSDGISKSGFRKVEYSENGTTWTDCSDAALTIEPGGGERATGHVNPADGSIIATTGDRALETIQVSGVYSEAVASLYRKARAALENGTLFCLRYSKAGTAGQLRHTTNTTYSYVSSCPVVGRPGGGDPLTFTFTIITSGITNAVIT
jgi:hypothetical protein